MSILFSGKFKHINKHRLDSTHTGIYLRNSKKNRLLDESKKFYIYEYIFT